MKVAVVGVGGVGGYFGGRLAQAGVDVTFVARGAMLDALRTTGLRVDSVNGDFAVQHVKATNAPSEPVDAVLVAVKAWQLAEAAPKIKPLLGADTVVVPLQNGIDAPDELGHLLGRHHVAGGLCALVSFVVEPGHIRHAGGNPYLMLGELDNRVTPRVERLCEALRAAGVDASVPPDIQKSMWSKFVFIAPLSGIGAVTRVPVGAFRDVPETRQLTQEAIAEVIAVASAKGIRLDADMLAKTMQRYDDLPADATSSFQRDIMAGRPSELEAQLGAVVRLGRETAVPTPVHRALYGALLPLEHIARKAS